MGKVPLSEYLVAVGQLIGLQLQKLLVTAAHVLMLLMKLSKINSS